MNFLNSYCSVSGQKVNASKSSFLLSPKAELERSYSISQATGFSHKNAPMEYLGTPIFPGRAKAVYFEKLFIRIRNKMAGWKNKLLSQGGRLCNAYKPKVRSRLGFNSIALQLGITYINLPPSSPVIVYWSRPPTGYVVLNSDGSSIDGEAAGGGVIRNSEGGLINNYFSFYGRGSNNLAESCALLDGLQLCISLGFNSIEVQSDSLLVINWLKKKIGVPWNLKHIWLTIHQISSPIDMICKHVYR
ncbi:hypothetical protein FRX31_007753 [Thalictrum thalictroides]|uniref:RNase H type-1 domain-containing protein n=1 Tax=Thalictrum thalictroides TaxID=46969 RepID=A0A7J6X1Q8_THATH|nr:hypothetical protein FRX31_007753 [Thalictrum thalictroides]